MKFFEEKIVWITGASSGIGEALVYESVKLGATVIASSNCKKELFDVRERCGDLKDKVNIACFDLSDTEDIVSVLPGFPAIIF